MQLKQIVDEGRCGCPGYAVVHGNILAHEDRGIMIIVEVVSRKAPYAHR